MYQKSGYQKTTVKYLPPAIEPNAGRGSVTFEIVEAPKVKIHDVQFNGANSIKQMGAVVKAAKSALEGKTVDGKALSDLVRERLSKLG